MTKFISNKSIASHLKLCFFFKHSIPVIAIVLLVFSGRFNIPFLKNGDYPIYIGILFLFVITLYSLKKKINNKNICFILFNILFIFYIFIRTWNSYNMSQAAKAFELTIYVFPLVLFILIIIDNKRMIDLVLFYTFSLTLFFAVLGLFSGDLGEGRLSVLGGGSNVYGRYMLFGFILSVYYLQKSNRLVLKIIIILLLFLFSILTIYSGSRQAVLGLVLALIIISALWIIKTINYKITLNRIKKISLLILLGFLMTILAKKFLVNTLIFNRLMLLTSDNKGSSVEIRLVLYDKSWKMFFENPLWGNGTRSFAENMPQGLTYPHNVYLELLAEYGIIGFLLFIVIVGISLLSLIRNYFSVSIENTSELNQVVTLITFIIISGYFSSISGDLYDSRWIFYFSAISIAIDNCRKKTKEMDYVYPNDGTFPTVLYDKARIINRIK